MKRKFKTPQEGIEFWENFNSVWGTTGRMSDYYFNKLEKSGELEYGCTYKKKNEILWDMFSDWEDVIARIDCDLHHLYNLKTDGEKVDWLNGMLEEYEWYLQR